MKPEGYPLPWNDAMDLPYWQINAILCFGREGWREWQGPRTMREIIPEIDAIISRGLRPDGLLQVSA